MNATRDSADAAIPLIEDGDFSQGALHVFQVAFDSAGNRVPLTEERVQILIADLHALNVANPSPGAIRNFIQKNRRAYLS